MTAIRKCRNRKMKTALLLAPLCVGLCGCAGTSGSQTELNLVQNDLAAARERAAELETVIQQKEQEIERLRDENQVLEDSRVSLDREKTIRIEQAREIRGIARRFIRAQTSALRLFSENPALLDYLGGEPIDRSRHEEGKSVLIIDLARPLPSAAMIFSGQIYQRVPLPFFFCLIRAQNQDYSVVWMSQEFNPAEPGFSTVSFEAGITAQKGDFLAVYCPRGVGMPYDELGGRCAVIKGSIGVGQAVSSKTFADPTTRGYSFGVLGFLE